MAVANEGIVLAALSDAALKEGHPLDAVRLALAAWPRKGDEERPQMRRVITALIFAMSEYHERARLAVPGAMRYAAYSPDGKARHHRIRKTSFRLPHLRDAGDREHLTQRSRRA